METVLTNTGIDASDLYRLASDVWTAVTELELEPIDEAGGKQDDMRYVTSCIQIVGERRYAVFMDCPEVVARLVAASMFDRELVEVTLDDAQDALGELCNIVGSQVMEMLPGQHQLGLPVVSSARNNRLCIPNCRILAESAMKHGIHPVHLSLISASVE